MPVLVTCTLSSNEIELQQSRVSDLSLAELEAKVADYVQNWADECREFDVGGGNNIHDDDIDGAFTLEEITAEDAAAFERMFGSDIGTSSGILDELLDGYY